MSSEPTTEAVRTVSRQQGPYVGLEAYDENDAAFFFGRSQESAIVAANLRSTKLTILYGPSGVGKSSLLMAGVVHGLREDARGAGGDSPFAVCVFRSWHGEPLRGLQEACRTALQDLAGEDPLTTPAPVATLADTLRAWTKRAGALLIVLDQFEEYFQYHPNEGDDERLTGFAAELADVVNDPSLAAHVVLSIREDAWASLDRFEGHIPSLFANYIRVDHLDLDAAREAITGPIDAWNRILLNEGRPYEIEPALVDAVIEGAAASGGLTAAAGPEAAAPSTPGDRVEAPFLQLVMERIWRTTVAAGAHTLTLSRLGALGGPRRIVENHLLDALGRLTREEQDIASDCFTFLVSRSRTKVAHPALDLADWTQRSEPRITPVLDKLCRSESGRILRLVATNSEDRHIRTYELYHDVLAEPILEWRRTHQVDRTRRAARWRLFRVVSVLLAVVGVFAALGVWALIQQRNADRQTARVRIQERLARSEVFRTRAGVAIPIDPVVGLQLAIEAARVSRERDAYELLGRVFSRLAAAAAGSGAIFPEAAFSPSGDRVVDVDSSGVASLWDAQSGRRIGTLRGGLITSAAFSLNGQRVATADLRGYARIWSTANCRLVRTLKSSTAVTSSSNPTIGTGLLTISFSRDGRSLLAGAMGGFGVIWRLRDGNHGNVGEKVGGDYHYPVFNASFGWAGRRVVTLNAAGGADFTVVNPRGFPRRKTIPLGEASRESVSSNGKMLVMTHSTVAHVWRFVPHRHLVATLGGNKAPLTGAVFNLNNTKVITTSLDGTARIWDADTGAPEETLKGHRGPLLDASFDRSGRFAVTAGADGTARIWRVATGDQVRVFHVTSTNIVISAGFSPDGSRIVTDTPAGLAEVWNIRSGRLEFALRRHRAGPD